MSLEFHAFIKSESIPTRDGWQEAIASLYLPLELDKELDPLQNTGYVPCLLNGKSSGFELYLDDAESLLTYYSHRKNEVAGLDKSLSFRWGSDLSECACVMAAAVALVNACGAITYYPNDDILYVDKDALLSETRELLDSLVS